MKPRLIALVPLLALLAVPSPAHARAKLVKSETINSAEGYTINSRRYGKMRLSGISVSGNRRPKCMVDVAGIEQMIARHVAAKTLNVRPMPGSASGVIVKLYLKYTTAGDIPTCVGNGPDCEMDVQLPDKAKLL